MKNNVCLVFIEKPKVERLGKLTEVHSQLLIDYIDMNPTSVLEDIKEKRCEAFQGLSISQRCINTWFINAK
jgi:hypothetical protein